MKSKFLNFLIVITSLIGYLEWGKDKKLFLFQAGAAIISKLFSDPGAVIHPLIIFPLVGQIMLVITIFQKTANKKLTFIGIAALGLLLGLMFVIGILGLQWKILLSTIPFVVVAVATISYHRKTSKTSIPVYKVFRNASHFAQWAHVKSVTIKNKAL